MRSVAAARRLRRRQSQLMLGMALFAFLATALIAGAGHSSAGIYAPAALAGASKADAAALAAAPSFATKAVYAASLSPTSAAAPRADGRLLASLVLAAVVSVLAVFNIGLLRHLRRVYASPRRGAWRRG